MCIVRPTDARLQREERKNPRKSGDRAEIAGLTVNFKENISVLEEPWNKKKGFLLIRPTRISAFYIFRTENSHKRTGSNVRT